MTVSDTGDQGSDSTVNALGAEAETPSSGGHVAELTQLLGRLGDISGDFYDVARRMKQALNHPLLHHGFPVVPVAGGDTEDLSVTAPFTPDQLRAELDGVMREMAVLAHGAHKIVDRLPDADDDPGLMRPRRLR